MLELKIEQDLKTALLAGDKLTVSTLRSLKSALLYVKVAEGKREAGLGDEQTTSILSKEAKKRQESADLYVQGGSQERADTELREKAIIEKYLPSQLSEVEITKIVDEVVTSMGANGPSMLGQVIASVRQKTNGSADGATIARIVKEKLGA
jgi:uncharacterized protein YqeY